MTKFTTLVAIVQKNEARRLAQTLFGLSREPAASPFPPAKTPLRLRRLFDGSISVQPVEQHGPNHPTAPRRCPTHAARSPTPPPSRDQAGPGAGCHAGGRVAGPV